MGQSIIRDKSLDFSIKIFSLYKQLIKDKEFILSKQCLRSCTSIGANVEEALSSYSKKDFLYKINIAYKEEKESLYWLKILNSQYTINSTLFLELNEIIKILAKIVLNKKKELDLLNK